MFTQLLLAITLLIPQQASTKADPLTMAIEAKFHNSVVALLECGAKANLEDDVYGSAAARAAADGQDAIVLAMIQHGADVKAPRNDVLQSAASKCAPSTLMAILKAGADINAISRYGYSALMAAAEGNVANTRALIEAGANVNLRAAGGGSALSEALTSTPKFGIPELLIAHHAQVGLLESGAKVNLYATEQGSSSNGDPPIVAAAEYGGVEAVKLLLAHGADINLRNDIGYEPAIGAAVTQGHTEVVRLLLSTRANFVVRSFSGRTPMEIAEENKSAAIIALLEQAENVH